MGLTDTRHAMSIDSAQKELLLAICLTVFERFRNIQLKLEETEQSYNLLNVSLLNTLRTSFDKMVDQETGDADIERLCQEFEKDDMRKSKKKEKNTSSYITNKHQKLIYVTITTSSAKYFAY